MMDDEVEKRSKEQRVSYAPYSKDASALVTDVRPVSCYAESKYNEKLMPLQERRAPRRPWMWIFGIVGALCLIGGLLAGFYLKYSIDSTIQDSMTVCDPKAPGYSNWLQNFEGSPNETKIDQDKETTIPLYNDFYIYNMTNPTEYLNGGVAALVERGPYVLRNYISFLDVNFDKTNVTYDEWHYYVPQDGLNGQKDLFCQGCDRNDVITNLNAAYLRLLGQAQNEGLLILASKCTQTQVANVASAVQGKLPFCNTTEAGNKVYDATCGCCNPYPGKLPTGEDQLECPTLTSLEGSTVGLFSLLAYYDEGVAVSDSHSAFTASGLYSPLLISKTVKEFALGFPHALAGYMLAKITITKTEEAFPGNEGALRHALATQANYTRMVGDMCASHCTMTSDLGQLGQLIMEGRMEDVVRCDYRLPNFIDSTAHRFLDGISCRPYSFALLSRLVCNPMLGGKGCECATAGRTYEDGCCLIKGENSIFGLSLGGIGCLQEIPGILDDRQFATAEQRQEFYAEKPKRSGQFTGCDDHEKVGWVSLANTNTAFDLWQYNQTDPTQDFLPPSPGRLLAFKGGDATRAALGGETYTSTVRGSLGLRFPGTKVTADLFSWHLSTGKPYNETFSLWIKQASRPVDVIFHGDADVLGVTTDEFRTEKRMMDRDFGDNRKTGTGVPMDGLDCLTMNYDFPVFVHRPNYLFGDPMILNQSVAPIRLEFDGSRPVGIAVYRGFAPYGSGASPLSRPLPQITPETLRMFEESYDTSMFVEPSSGVTVVAHGRLGASFAVFSCDPKDTFSASCALFPDPSARCYTQTSSLNPLLGPNASLPCSAANVLTPKVMGDQIIPQYWVDQNSEVNDFVAGKLRDAGKLHLLSGILLVVVATLGGVFLFASAWIWCRSRVAPSTASPDRKDLEGADDLYRPLTAGSAKRGVPPAVSPKPRHLNRPASRAVPNV